MIHRGLILQPTYRVHDGVPVVRLFGRLESGEPFLVEDDRFRPYFFVLATQTQVAEESIAETKANASVAETPLRSLEGRSLARVTMDVPGSVPPLRETLEQRGARTFEADIRFPYRYLIDHEIRGAAEIEGDFRTENSGLLRFANPTLRPGDCRPPLRVLSIDLETSPDAGRIFSAALVGDGINEVHLVSEAAVEGAIVSRDESILLQTVAGRIRAVDPDIITGWNVVDFDLRTWIERCKALRVAAPLGRVRGDVFFQQDRGFTRQSRAAIPGRMVLDGIPLVRDAVRLDDYRLETVARALLGRGKLIDGETIDAAQEIERRYREDPAALVAYNREDAQLVLDILEKEGLLELALERSLLSGMQLDRVGASIASFDLLYLPELRRRGFAAASVDRDRKSEMVKGGALLEPQPGVFRNVGVFDFKSLYPSLIRTFQLDPLAHAAADAAADGAGVVAPNGAAFSRQGAILPDVIERFMSRREDAKARGDRHADQAIKIMMNAMFGVLGAASCRFFNADVANAITGFGQQTLHWTREAFEQAGMRVLYGDTDSVFVQLSQEAGEAGDQAQALRVEVQQRIHQRIRDTYAVEPRLELELEHVYDGFFLPRVRGGKGGSKKRYAGWSGGKLEVVGLEAVRRDWPAVAGRLQRGLLERLFTDRELVPFAKEVVDAVLAGELDDELVYVKRVRKASLDGYTATTPPHIQAARKAGGRIGRVVRYVITANGPEPVFPGRDLPPEIDHRHYIERVLRPVADAILQPLELDFGEALGEPRQLSLL